MDDFLHDDDWLVRYIDDELSQNEKVELENRLRIDPVLQDRLASLRVATEAIRQYGTRQQVSKVHAEMMQELKLPKAGKVVGMRRNLHLAMAVAASILVVVVGIIMFLSSQVSSEKLYDEAFVDFQISTSRSAAPQLSIIEQRYQQKDYPAVVASMRSVKLAAKDSLLVALSYLQTGKPAQAIGILQTLASANQAFKQDAEFYLALAYLKNKQEQKALSLVEKINRDPSHLYHEKFDEDFLKKLRRLTGQ